MCVCVCLRRGVAFRYPSEVSKDAERIQGDFAAVWNTALEHYASTLESYCPQWALARNELLEPKNKAVAESPAFNPKYPEIGPLAQRLGKQVKVIKDVTSDKLGSVVAEGVPKRCRAAVDGGIETVAFGFVLFNILKEWPENILNVPMAKKAVKGVRADLAATGVVLTEELEETIKGWESGYLLPDNVAVRPKVEAQKAAKEAEDAPPAADAGGKDGNAIWENELLQDLIPCIPDDKLHWHPNERNIF